MLNLLVAMLKLFLGLTFLFFQAGEQPTINSPLPAAILQGSVPITGTTSLPGFLRWELSFAYANDTTDTWFLINAIEDPVANAQLFIWDTTTVTDGDYHLKLKVYLMDGSTPEARVTDLKIRNYTPVPEHTATIDLQTEAPQPIVTENIATTVTMPSMTTYTPTRGPVIISSQTPINPAEIRESSVFTFISLGALVTLITFGVISLLLRIRRS